MLASTSHAKSASSCCSLFLFPVSSLAASQDCTAVGVFGQHAGGSVATIAGADTGQRHKLLSPRAKHGRQEAGAPSRPEEGVRMFAGGTGYSTRKKMILTYNNSRPETV